jgi:hypothetical protein
MEPTHSTTLYLWIAAYEAAVFETADALMPGRIPEALAAIEQRLLSPIDIDGHEFESIVRAQNGLQALRAERAQVVNRPVDHSAGLTNPGCHE